MISSAATTSSSLIDSTYKFQTDLSDDTDLEPDALMLPGGSVDPDPQPQRELSFPGGMPSSGPGNVFCLSVRTFTEITTWHTDKS